MTMCSGKSVTHCCVFNGQECKYLETNTMPDRVWVCGLMRKYGQDWDTVIASPEWQTDVLPLYQTFVWPFSEEKYTCKTWPSWGCDCKGGK